MWYKNLGPYVKSLSVFHKIVRKSSQALSKKLGTENHDLNIFKIGHKLHGFEVKDVKEITEFRLTAIYLIHEKTRAEYLHLYRNDNNNVFAVNFRTTPMNSTGLPHILEHTVLCGSKLYPVRDPFFKMLNRSLATFMNAMTGSDYTMYPFSTQNLSDYRNLQKIYLDAAFRPNLKELDFMQEGWRLENVNPVDNKTPLIIKGVVYNEMKGAFSENENILGQKLQNLILPDHTYGVISGGDPIEIPNLTWEDLKNFHRMHYHPSNAKFYSYGNFPLSPSLEYIDKLYLSQYDYQPPNHTMVPKQTRWKEPKREHINCRFENMREPFESQNTISISLLLSDITEIYDTFLMNFVTELLIKGPNSPFYKSMIEPNFSGGFTPTTGFDTQPRDSIFTIGLQGLKQEDFDKVVGLFDNTLDQVVTNGFDEKHIESVLHRYELAIKHESANFGLHLLFGIIPTWNHNGNILSSLQINSLIEKLKKEMKQDNHYLQNVVKRYFKDNNHRLVLTMSPDKDYEKKQKLQEEELINRKTGKLSESKQNENQKTDILPTLYMEDISNDVEKVFKDKVTINSVPVQINKVNSNGIIYFKALLNTVDLSAEQQMLLPLFCYVINKLGTDKLNYRDFDSLMTRKTAGLNLCPHIGESLFQLHNYEPSIYISSYCLEKNAEAMWDLWSQIFNISKLEDVERFQMLTQLYMANLAHGLADSGHVYAMQAAAGLVSGTAYQKELLTGLQHISYMKRLMGTSHYKAVLDELLNMAKIVFSKNNMRCAFNISQESQSKIMKTFANFTAQLPQTSKKPKSDRTYVEGKVWAPLNAINCQHHVLNVPVNYCSKAILTAPYSNKEYAKLRVLARLLSAKYLHPELRERQGAYGGGAKMTQDGVFVFYSYRDPRNLQTLDVFDNTSKWLEEHIDKVTPQEILEAKLGVFQAVDAPIPPSNKGCEEFLRRLTPDILQRHRAEIMSVDQNELRTAAEKYLKNAEPSLNAKVVLGPKSDKFDTNNRHNEILSMALPTYYNNVKDYFEDTLNFLKAYHWLYSYPNTHVLVNNVFDQFPAEWPPYLRNLTSEGLNDLARGHSLEDAPKSLEEFLKKVKKLKMITVLKDANVDFTFPNNSGLSIKKKHEIVALAPLIKEICDESGCDFIVDVGTGLGHLPQLLHEKYNYRILGIEGSPENVQQARANQMKYPKSVNAIKYVTHFITNQSEEQINKMVEEIAMSSACITGLHACADLSVTVLELFMKLEFAKSLVIMPCCYHRLKENERGFENFPVSSLLRELSHTLEITDYLNIPFLRVACQGSVDGFSTMTQQEHEQHANSCMFRAILQDVANSENCQVKRLKRKSGKLRQSGPISEPFETYLTNLKHTHTLIGGSVSDDQFLKKMREKWTQHKGNVSLIEALAALQAAIQNICENVVLLDRVMFLMEKGVKCFVVKVTDQGISPRCHALVAMKP
ncbi:presequence protease, mitochondrial [Asbolus verrucosus]|uniref:Presequence protease, mitochondrial n=1 Tax=Asbolus verrucosus TaxID=1661398 RepID=A0A482VGS0_ASBVE|nr:presequence protease, mitochondrial [Asbolus verrucosus]